MITVRSSGWLCFPRLLIMELTIALACVVLFPQINDILEHRVEKNLRQVSRTAMVLLPDNASFSLEDFVTVQEQHIRSQTDVLKAKNVEVETAVEDLIELLLNYPLDGAVGAVSEDELNKLRLYYNGLMYQVRCDFNGPFVDVTGLLLYMFRAAVIVHWDASLCHCSVFLVTHVSFQCVIPVQALVTSARSSLNSIKTRLFRRMQLGFLFIQQPFFDVDVQLSVPSVRLSPALEDVQKSVNRIAAAVLHAFKFVWEWGQLGDPDPDVTHTPQHGALTPVVPSPVARTPRRQPGVMRGLFTAPSYRNHAELLTPVLSPGVLHGKVSFFERIGQDVEIVKVVLLLTGAFHGIRNHISEYLLQFKKYDWLWKDDMEAAYKRFAATQPTIDVRRCFWVMVL